MGSQCKGGLQAFAVEALTAWHFLRHTGQHVHHGVTCCSELGTDMPLQPRGYGPPPLGYEPPIICIMTSGSLCIASDASTTRAGSGRAVSATPSPADYEQARYATLSREPQFV